MKKIIFMAALAVLMGANLYAQVDFPTQILVVNNMPEDAIYFEINALTDNNGECPASEESVSDSPEEVSAEDNSGTLTVFARTGETHAEFLRFDDNSGMTNPTVVDICDYTVPVTLVHDGNYEVVYTLNGSIGTFTINEKQ